MDPETKKLYIKLVNAGKLDQAQQLLAAYEPAMGRRTGGELGERGEILARGKELGMDREDLFVPPESQGSAFVADLGYELKSQGLGAQQLAEHLLPGRDTAGIDERVRQSEAEYQATDLPDRATGGRFAGAAIPAVAGSVLARGALAARPLLTSSAIGGGEEAIQPVPGDDFWLDKGKQVGIGSSIGMVTEGVPASAIRGSEMVVGAPGAAHRSLAQPSRKPDGGMFRGSADEMEANRLLAEETGIDLTPAQLGDSPALQQTEELARSGLLTQNRVKTSDKARSGQYDDYIQQVRNSLGDDAPIDVVAPKIQAWGGERAREMIETRHIDANNDYKWVREFAGGRPVVDASNYRSELDFMIRQGDQAGASEDMIRAAKGADARLTRLDEQGGMLTGSDVEMLTRATDTKFSGSPFDLKDPTFNEQIAGNLRNAVLEDAKKIPDLHKDLMTAKKNYATASSHIDEFEKGLVGQVIGKSFMSEIDDMIVNSVTPETLFQKFRTSSPTQIDAALKHIDANAPELGNQFRASFLERARQGATFKSSAAGMDETLDPSTFLRNLGLTGSGEKGMQGYERLIAMFPENQAEIKNLYRAGMILGDKSMVNASRSGVTINAKEMFDSITGIVTGSLRKIFGTVGSVSGLRQVAKSMDVGPGGGIKSAPYRMPRVRAVRESTRIPALGATTAIGEDQ